MKKDRYNEHSLSLSLLSKSTHAPITGPFVPMEEAL